MFIYIYILRLDLKRVSYVHRERANVDTVVIVENNNCVALSLWRFYFGVDRMLKVHGTRKTNDV